MTKSSFVLAVEYRHASTLEDDPHLRPQTSTQIVRLDFLRQPRLMSGCLQQPRDATFARYEFPLVMSLQKPAIERFLGQ